MSRFGVGQPVRRTEDLRFPSGRACFVDDLAAFGTVHALVVRSAHAHARILRVDVEQARRAPGVVAVLTGADAKAEGLGGVGVYRVPPGFGGPRTFWPARPVLALDRVRHLGDGVALIVAETLALARDAAETVTIEYEQLPVNVSAGAASARTSVRLWEEAEGNTCFAYALGDRSATEAAFARAAHVVCLALLNNRLSANPLEPRGALGLYDPLTGRFTLHSPPGARGTYNLPNRGGRCAAQQNWMPTVRNGSNSRILPDRSHVSRWLRT